jgi:hypothetical protein
MEDEIFGECDYFAGIALALNETHRTTVKAKGSLKCILMTKNAFIRFVQSELDMFKEREAQYRSFSDRYV